MDGHGGAAHDAVTYRTEVIGVDLDADDVERSFVNVQPGANRTERFGECDRCAAMEESEGLAGSVVDGKGRDNPFAVELFVGDAKSVSESVCGAARQPRNFALKSG